MFPIHRSLNRANKWNETLYEISGTFLSRQQSVTSNISLDSFNIHWISRDIYHGQNHPVVLAFAASSYACTHPHMVASLCWNRMCYPHSLCAVFVPKNLPRHLFTVVRTKRIRCVNTICRVAFFTYYLNHFNSTPTPNFELHFFPPRVVQK